MDPYVDENLQWRPITVSDLAEIDALREQIELLDDPVLGSLERLVGDVDPSRIEENSVGGWDNYGNLIAYGWNVAQCEDSPRVHLIGGVHPTHRYKGIGGALLRWQVSSAAEWRDHHHPGRELWIGCYVDHSQPSLSDLLTRLGFGQERYFYDLHRDLTRLPEIRQVPGIQFVPFDAAHADGLRLLHNRSHGDDTTKHEVPPERWQELLHHQHFEPQWSWVALSDGVPVGYALSAMDQSQPEGELRYGWTDRVAVAPEYRGRGISLALLTRTLTSMANDGCQGAGIGVDTVDPASPAVLAENLGYEARDGLVLMSRLVPPQVR